MQVSPLVFDPIFQPRIWGGRRLAALFDKPLPAADAGPIGESWEVVDLAEAQSVVAAGPERGTALADLVARWGGALLGGASLFEGRFPLLIKFLDARENLSVQVHPSPAVAKARGGNVRAKHEAWYVLEADPGAVIYHDLVPGVTAEAFRAALADGSVVSLLRKIPAKAGQCYYIPSGTVHALGAGVVVAEVQTPSDTTFRLYDWDRTGPDGKPRQLHVDAALACIRFGEPIEPCQPRSHVAGVFTTVTQLVKSDFFNIEKVQFSAGLDQAIPYAELVTWIVLAGRGTVTCGRNRDVTVAFKPGDTVVLPARLEHPRVQTETDCVWLEVTLPVPSDLRGFARPDADSLRSGPERSGLPIFPGA